MDKRTHQPSITPSSQAGDESVQECSHSAGAVPHGTVQLGAAGAKLIELFGANPPFLVCIILLLSLIHI